MRHMIARNSSDYMSQSSLTRFYAEKNTGHKSATAEGGRRMSHSHNDFPIAGYWGRKKPHPKVGKVDVHYMLINPATKNLIPIYRFWKTWCNEKSTILGWLRCCSRGSTNFRTKPQQNPTPFFHCVAVAPRQSSPKRVFEKGAGLNWNP